MAAASWHVPLNVPEMSTCVGPPSGPGVVPCRTAAPENVAVSPCRDGLVAPASFGPQCGRTRRPHAPRGVDQARGGLRERWPRPVGARGASIDQEAGGLGPPCRARSHAAARARWAARTLSLQKRGQTSPKSASPGRVESPPNGIESAANGVEASEFSRPLETTGDRPGTLRQDPDEALRAAIVAALEAGQLDRAARLLDVLRATAALRRAPCLRHLG
jgi:hypothetical protein